MREQWRLTSVVGIAVFTGMLAAVPGIGYATSLRGDGSPADKAAGGPAKGAPLSSKHQTVKTYVEACLSKSPKPAECEQVRKEGVEILKEDLRTVGSSANRTYLPGLVKMFTRLDPELRIAAADAIGMIGPEDGDRDVLAPLANDPVPDVRRAVSQMLSRGKGSAVTLLGQRTMSIRTGLTPETAPDPAKYSMPVAPGSTYLFYTSDAAAGRLSYTVKGMTEAVGFFKSKAKKGPMKLHEFQDTYRFQLEDEERARNRTQDEAAKQLEKAKPDPTNMKSFMEYMEKMQTLQAGRTTTMLLDTYLPAMFKEPTVYVLEERQIGKRTYPTRYAVLYQDLALNQPGYRLSWMTVPEDAIKVAQAASLAEEEQEAARAKRQEARQKEADALQDMVKKKDEQEKKKFKKGQADLEKELGF